MLTRAILTSSTIGFGLIVSCQVQAQGQSGDVSLRKGLKGRVVEQRAQGVLPQKNASGRVNAGYYRLRFTPVGLTDASECPRTAFATSDAFKKWRKSEDKIYDLIFDRKGIWSITAAISLRINGVDKTPREVRLIRIQNPEERNCKIVVAGSEPGDMAALDAASFPIPINYSNVVYDDKIQLILKSKYNNESNDARLSLIWDGLKLFGTTVTAGLGPIIGAMTPMGKTETAELVKTDVETAVPLTFESVPPAAERANRMFIYLGFPPLPNTPPATLTGGMSVHLDYQASLFRVGAFYDPAKAITADEVIEATPIPATDGLKTVRDSLDTNIYRGLADANSVAAYDAACSIARPAQRKLDLSEVDANTFLLAAAAKSTHKEVSEHLDALKCFGSSERENLALMGVRIVAPIPPVVTRQATWPEMDAALKNLGALMQGETAAPGSPLNSDLTERFAEKVTVVLVDEAAQGWAGLSEVSVELPRMDALSLLARKFSNIGCFAPRESTPDLLLPLRPRFVELPEKARGGAALILSREPKARVFVMSFGMPSVEEGKRGVISRVQIGRRGTDTGPVTDELLKARRPKACTNSWMDEAFEAPQ